MTAFAWVEVVKPHGVVVDAAVVATADGVVGRVVTAAPKKLTRSVEL